MQACCQSRTSFRMCYDLTCQVLNGFIQGPLKPLKCNVSLRCFSRPIILIFVELLIRSCISSSWNNFHIAPSYIDSNYTITLKSTFSSCLLENFSKWSSYPFCFLAFWCWFLAFIWCWFLAFFWCSSYLEYSISCKVSQRLQSLLFSLGLPGHLFMVFRYSQTPARWVIPSNAKNSAPWPSVSR